MTVKYVSLFSRGTAPIHLVKSVAVSTAKFIFRILDVARSSLYPEST
jgi:hypothetical protein